ncbi:hypothetical protein [Cupriavidus necator]
MSKAKIVRDSEGLFYGVKFLCPGCLYSDGRPSTHILPVNWLPPGETKESPHNAGKDHWSFSGDFERPAFGPSVNTWWGGPSTEIPLHRCHSFIGINGAAPGQIKFLEDCTHALANQTVDLPELED